MTKVSIGVGDEIVLGMPAEEMKQRLEGSVYQKEEDEKGENYFIYSDESKKNFIRIFVDKDLQLVESLRFPTVPRPWMSTRKMRMRKQILQMRF